MNRKNHKDRRMYVSMSLIFYHSEKGFLLPRDKDGYYQIVEEMIYENELNPIDVLKRIMMKYYFIYESFYFQRRFIKYMEKNEMKVDEENIQDEVKYLRMKYINQDEKYQDKCMMEEMFDEIMEDWFLPRRVHHYDISKDSQNQYFTKIIVLELENISFPNDKNTMLSYPFFYNKKLNEELKKDFIYSFEWKRLYDLSYEECTTSLWDALDFLDVGIEL